MSHPLFLSKMDSDIFAPVVGEIERGKRFLVVSHVNPEGDAVGSLLGLALALRGIGKDVVAFLEDEVPDVCRFLPGSDTIVHSLDGVEPVDCTFAVDCGQIERLGEDFVRFNGRGRLVNLDHHKTNDEFGDINIVLPGASAAGEIVYDLLKAARIPINADVATNLYVAIHTDTGSFRYASATPEAFRKAGELVSFGADPWDVSRNVYESYPAKRFEALSMVLSTLETVSEGRIAVLKVTLDMLKKVGGGKDIVDGFVNYARAIKGVEVGVLFRECGPDEYKVSLRSKGNIDVSGVAKSFGGGGHPHASGFNISGEFGEVKQKVLDALRKAIKEGLRS